MKTCYLSFFFTLLAISTSFSQARTITGRLLSAADTTVISNALIQVEGSKISTNSDSLGNFLLNLKKSSEVLIISHINFENVKIKIPDLEAFSVLLKPQKIIIEGLDISNYPASLSQTIEKQSQKQSISLSSQSAEYAKGWDNFYKQLGKHIVEHPEYSDESESFFHYTEFLITEEGEIENIKLKSDSGVNHKAITESLARMDDWIPALQNEKPVSQVQHFAVYREKIDTTQTFQIVDKPAVPTGGFSEFYTYIGKNLRYPAEARRMGIEGTVYVQFIVEKDGSLTEIQISRGIGGGCDEEAIRLMKNCPNWLPPRQKGVPVRQRIVLPIKFQLG